MGVTPTARTIPLLSWLRTCPAIDPLVSAAKAHSAANTGKPRAAALSAAAHIHDETERARAPLPVRRPPPSEGSRPITICYPVLSLTVVPCGTRSATEVGSRVCANHSALARHRVIS